MELSRIIDVTNNICANNIKHIIGFVASKQLWTFEKILKYKKEEIFNNPLYKKLPRWAHSEINGYWKAYLEMHESKLVWTHFLDGRRIRSKDKELEGRYQEINSQKPNRSAFCYVIEKNGVESFIPYREEERRLDGVITD